MELEDKLKQLKKFIDLKDFRPNGPLFGPYPMNWPIIFDDSLFDERQDDQFLTEHENWIKNRGKYSFEKEVKDAIRYFERIFESAFEEIVSLSSEFRKMFFIVSNKFEDIQKVGTDTKVVKLLFSTLCKFLEQNLNNKNKSFYTLDHTLYSRKSAIIESIKTESQFSEDVIEFLIVENRIVLVERFMARIRGDVCILLYFIFRTSSEYEQRSNIIDFFFFLLRYVKFSIRDEYISFVRDIELSFKLKNVPEKMCAKLQQLKEEIHTLKEKPLNDQELCDALGRRMEYIRLMKKAMKSAGIKMISGKPTLSEAKAFLHSSGFQRTRNGYKCNITGEVFEYSKRGKKKRKVAKRK